MKKSDELKKIVDELRAKADSLQQNEQYDDALKVANELKDATRDWKIAKALEDAEVTDFVKDAKPANETAKEDEKKVLNRAFNKAVFGIAMTDDEKAVLDRAKLKVTDAAGAPGQVGATPAKGGYLVPEEQINQLREYRKAYTALKNYCSVHTANSTTGSMPTLGDEQGTLTAFEELNEIKQSDFDFGQIKYSIADYGDIIPVSNQLLQDADIDLMSIIGQRFARKSVNTENQKILDLLGKLTATTITGYKNLTKALNVDLDPVYYANARIFTNQDGFEWMSELEDAHNRPLLIPDVTAADTYRFRGKEVVVLSNNTLATAKSKIPFYIGSMSDYAAFFQRLGVEVAVSAEAGFTKYATYIRAVERFGVEQDDTDALKAYSVAVSTGA